MPAGVPAAQIVFSCLGEQYCGYKVMDTIMIFGDNACSISCVAREEVFEKHLGATRKMMSLFKRLSGYRAALRRRRRDMAAFPRASYIIWA